MKRKLVLISRFCANCSNHNPSQATSGNSYIAACKKITMGLIGAARKLSNLDILSCERKSTKNRQGAPRRL